MQNPNSLDRIVSYFKACCTSPFMYRGKEIQPYKQLKINQLALRSYDCPEECGACCMRCSLVWFTPPENLPHIEKTRIQIGHAFRDVWIDYQMDHNSHFCRYLDPVSGRCTIYEERPFACQLELFKFMHYVSRGTAYARVTLPGRGWNLTKVDGERGALCTINKHDPAQTKDIIQLLHQLAKFMQMFGIANDIEQMTNFLKKGEVQEQKELIINRSQMEDV